MSRISAIIPVYNAADSLPRLIESLRMQTMRDFTAIFIDDGSTDGGIGILRDIADRDGRFVVLEGSHAGPGAARNLGLDEADRLKSEFVTFIDADDFIAKDALETAVGILDDSGFDIVHYPWVDDETLLECEIPPLSTPSIYVWNKTYRRSAIQGIRFLNSDYAEDLAYFLETDANAPQRIACDKALYVHIKRAGSLWESRNPSSVCRSMKIVIEHLSRFFAEHPDAKGRSDWIRLYLPKLLKNQRRALQQLPRINRKKECAEFFAQVRLLRFLRQFPFFCMRELKFRVFTMTALVLSTIGSALSRWCSRISVCRFRYRYARRIRDIRKRGNRRIKVVFFVTEISKWKTRSVFDAMIASPMYDPVLAVGLDKGEEKKSVDKRLALVESRIRWFRERGIEAVSICDIKTGRTGGIYHLCPDIVFYQQPWQIPDVLSPEKVSHYALTFYVPYCLADFGNIEAECLMPFFKNIFGYFVQSRAWARLYSSAAYQYACRFISTGHPMLDQFSVVKQNDLSLGYIIYAPHWTFGHTGSVDLYPYGTFEWNGIEILRYAQQHADWNWVFKPHPLLREALFERGLMSHDEIDAYYAAWENLGVACYDADYPILFAQSRAMITDSGSFLVEYAATGKPLIHLKPRNSCVKALSPNCRLFNSYYQVSDLENMFKVFATVLDHMNDPAREERMMAVKSSGLFGVYAAGRILRWLNVLLSQRKELLCKD